MSELAQRGDHHIALHDFGTREHRITSTWVGWLGFASVIMILSGMFQAIEGIVGLSRQSFFIVAHSSQILIVNSVHTWGWINLIVGIVVLLAGFSLMSSAAWAKAVAVLFALGSAIVNMLYLPLYPVWSIICIALSVIVIYAIMAHGAEITEE
jgi:hypothetical protein